MFSLKKKYIIPDRQSNYVNELYMHDDNLLPVISVMLYSYTHGSVVAEYNLVSILLWIHKTRLVNIYCFVKSFYLNCDS